MHNKLFVTDGQGAIVGGRNLMDAYFGLGAEICYRDFGLSSTTTPLTPVAPSPGSGRLALGSRADPSEARVRAFLADHPRLQPHSFPAYAPELNPAEDVWAQPDHELANGAPDDLRDLRHRLDAATRCLRRSQPLLSSCVHASDLPWTR